MKLLLDTHVLLWAAGSCARLQPETCTAIDAAETVLFSVASLWEIAIKHGLGRADFEVEPRVLRRSLLDNGYTELAISSEHAVEIGALPSLHKDPFDRLLVAQARVEGVILLTADDQVAQYGGPVRKI